MTLEQIKSILKESKNISFQLPDGSLVPAHFHVTEVGKVTKDFIDCGGTRRTEEVVNFQLWEENDYDHRLHPEKLLNIIELSQKTLGLTDQEIEVEYQGATIGKYNLEYVDNQFKLVNKQTNCLAMDKCGIPVAKKAVELSDMISGGSCTPGSGCC